MAAGRTPSPGRTSAPRPGLFAAAALLLDYVLVVAVGISAGVGALVSASAGASAPHALALPGDPGVDHAGQPPRRPRVGRWRSSLPTYLFIVSLLAVLAIGVVKTFIAGGHPTPVEEPRRLAAGGRRRQLLAPDAGIRQRLHGDDGRRGRQQRSQPRSASRPSPNARRTLDGDHRASWRSCWRASPICAMPTTSARRNRGRTGYQSILSQLVAAVIGRGFFYYVTIGSVLAVLALSANTGFADFPRLCRVVAAGRFLPSGFAHRGRRLVYSQGIIVLAVLSGGLLIAFDGITDHLIPLFAVGAFLAFTLSQAGMVVHWRGWRAARREVDGDQWRGRDLHGGNARHRAGLQVR